MSLQGQFYLITGAASGMGSATAHVLLEEGAAGVSLLDISEQGLKTVEKEITAKHAHSKILSFKVDVKDRQQVEQAVRRSFEEFKALDGAVNAAGVPPGKPQRISELEEEVWEHVMGVNLLGVVNSLRAEMKYLKRGASVVNIASIAALYGQPTYSAYGTSKAGVVSLTKTAARDYGADGIRVNAICPGAIDTPLFRQGIDQKQYTEEQLCALTCLKRIGQPRDIANAAAFLLSDKASFITGTVLVIDGGHTA